MSLRACELLQEGQGLELQGIEVERVLLRGHGAEVSDNPPTLARTGILGGGLAVAELGDQAKDIGLELRVADSVIAADQRHHLAPVEGLARCRRGFLSDVLGDDTVWITLEEERRGHLDHLRDIVERSKERRVGKECRSRWSPY